MATDSSKRGRGRPVKPYRPLTDEQRVDALRRFSDIGYEAQDLMWSLAASFLDTGTPAQDLAEAMGLTRRTFYARLAQWRQAQTRR